jgi:hypothetical protein
VRRRRSFASGAKSVTRRLARPGIPPWRVGALSKCYERSPRAGGKPFMIVRIERCDLWELGTTDQTECALEGFPAMSPRDFITMFAKINHLDSASFEELEHIFVWRVAFDFDIKQGEKS